MNTKETIGIFPGTFDPITLGHVDVIERSTKIVDKLYVAVASSTHKQNTMFSPEERVEMAKSAIEEKLPKAIAEKVEVVTFDNLLVEYAHSIDANIIIRSLRNISDFDFEFQMAGMNSSMSKDIETLFLIASKQYQFVSSAFVREIAKLEGELSPFASDNVVAALRERCKKS